MNHRDFISDGFFVKDFSVLNFGSVLNIKLSTIRMGKIKL